MKITVSVAGFVAVILGVTGAGLVTCSVVEVLPMNAHWAGDALLIIAGVAWLQHRIDLGFERERHEREDDAFRLGRLTRVPSPRESAER